MSEYLLHRRAIMMGIKEPEKKEKVKFIPKISEKKRKQLKSDKPERNMKEMWFAEIRPLLTGTCQCGCGEPSSKNDDNTFRSSCCHIFPKNIFKSVRFHPLNFVERNFHNGCHTNMDNQGLDKWPNMADWEDIKMKFLILAPLLTPKERTHKFFTHLQWLIDNEASVIIASHDKELQTTIIEKG